MHITHIELENIKSHRRSSFDFGEGTTAIVGRNGAGKTTIIEAIAWALFDVLDHNKEDFVTRGAKKGTVKVSFRSGLDEREYTVVRDTAAAYYVFDPFLKTRIANRKEEVVRFLWQHLGVEPGTNLKTLFKEAVGVPQGTLTAVFKATAGERKPVFDSLLRVDEFRNSAESLKKTRRHIDAQIQAVQVRIANAEGQLDRYDVVKGELEEMKVELASLGEEVARLETEEQSRRTVVSAFETASKKVSDLKASFDRLEAERSRSELVLAQKDAEAKRARDASEILERSREGHERHLKAAGMLKELERERTEREKLSEESRKIEAAEVRLRSDQKRYSEELAKVHEAAKEIETLKPKVSVQQTLETGIRKLRDSLSEARGKEQLAASLDKDIERLRDEYKKNQADIRKAEELVAAGDDIAALRARDEEVTREMTKLRTQLEYDEKFQREIRGGLCPILSAKCLNLKEGETLEAFLKSQFAELKTRIGELEAEHETVSAKLKSAQGAERAAGALAALRENERNIAVEGKRLAGEKEKLAAEMPNFGNVLGELDAAEERLGNLDDPRAKTRALEREVAREGDIRDALGEVEKNFERLETGRKELAEGLAKYRDLDENWGRFSAERDETLEAHREFIRNEAAAASLAACESALAEAKAATEKLSAALADAEAGLKEASKGYDAAGHAAERAALIDVDRRLTATRTNFGNVETRKSRAEDELLRLEEVKKSMRGEEQEKERLEQVGEVTDFICKTLRDAAPRVARNYVHHIALEANQLFRDITGNAERTLKWTEDYGIQLEEDGYDRPFGSLSGGEQMSAALAVRLALLKQLSEIRIAFFDEPTTNMDAERRERLAEQVSEITRKKSFDQLFMISHDDTFEHHVDNVITVGED